MIRQARAATLALTLAIAAAGSAPPVALAQSAGRADMVALSVCNRTSGKVFLALSYLESPRSSRWVVEGWKVIQAGSCFRISVPNDSYVYDYAEDETNGSWGGDFKLCVEHPGPFRRINSGSYTCAAQDLVGFAETDVRGATSKTINLNP